MDTERIADALMAVLGTGKPVGRFPGLGMADAYAVAAEVRARRERRGERVVGRKIGFTNTNLWPIYGVTGPMWGYMYDSTVAALDVPLVAAGLAEPRIEPEIVLGLGAAPAAGMSDAELLGCVAWVAHGFEVVQSVYPGWKLTGPESAAAFGLHGALRIGPRHPAGPGWAVPLAEFEVSLARDGRLVERGRGANVLGGPVRALRFLIEEIARFPGSPPLEAGEVVTTGTLTDAQPVKAGEVWSTEITGLPLRGISVVIA